MYFAGHAATLHRPPCKPAACGRCHHCELHPSPTSVPLHNLGINVANGCHLGRLAHASPPGRWQRLPGLAPRLARARDQVSSRGGAGGRSPADHRQQVQLLSHKCCFDFGLLGRCRQRRRVWLRRVWAGSLFRAGPLAAAPGDRCRSSHGTYDIAGSASQAADRVAAAAQHFDVRRKASCSALQGSNAKLQQRCAVDEVASIGKGTTVWGT